MFTLTTLLQVSLILLAASSVYGIITTDPSHFAYPDNFAFRGNATFYSPPAGSVSACPNISPTPAFAVALSPQAFNSTPNACGQAIQINYLGKYVVAQLIDRCQNCSVNGTDLELSQSVYSAYGADPTKDLRFPDPGIAWTFVPPDTPLGLTNSPPPGTLPGSSVYTPKVTARNHMSKTDGESAAEPDVVRRDMPRARNLKNRMVDEHHWMPRKRSVPEAPANERRMIMTRRVARP